MPISRHKKWIGRRKFNSSGRPPVLKIGDLIELGVHKLLCGDSSLPKTISKITDGKPVETFIYDPEWDNLVELDFDCPHKLVFTSNRDFERTIKTFGMPTWVFIWDNLRPFHLSRCPRLRARFCLWYGNLSTYKDVFQYGDKVKQSGVVKGFRGVHLASSGKERALSDVFTLSKSAHGSGLSWHSRVKPWPWMAMLIANCTKGVVLDPFGGGGSTLIACEKIDRICHMVEIDPAQCERIIERYLGAYSRKDDIITLNGKEVNWYQHRSDLHTYKD